MTQRFKSCILLLFIATGSARGLSSNDVPVIAATAGITTGIILLFEHAIYPAMSGSWERQRQEKIAQDFAAQQARDRAYAQRLMADTISAYAPEFKQLTHLTKQDLVTIVTGKYGNREHKFFTYDQELEQTLMKLLQVNISALEPAEQEAFYALLTNVRELHRQKNLLLSTEITKQIEQHREIKHQEARFDAELKTQQKLQEVIRDVHGVVQEQANNRSWMEAMFKDTARAARTEGERTREQINNVVHTMQTKDLRDSTWQGRQDDNWRRLQNDMRDRERDQHHGAPHRPPPYNPNF